MEDKIKFDAVILDVDGTVWDSTPIVAKAWTEAAKNCGINQKISEEQLKGLFGKTMHEIADALLPDATPETKEKVMYACVKEEEKALETNERDITYPGVADTIRALSEHIPVCIVSNGQKGYIELFMDKAGVTDVVSDFECYGNTGQKKAKNLTALIERNGYKNPVYVGDTIMDEMACDEAGVPFIYASYGFGIAKHPIFTIDSFKNLLNILN